jgi:hypothetical protein
MKSRPAISPLLPAQGKTAHLRLKLASARKSADAAKELAKKAKAELKLARKAYKQAKLVAKEERKKLKAWKKMIEAATQSAAPAKSKPLAPAKPTAAKRRTANTSNGSKTSRPKSRDLPEKPSTALSLADQSSSGATLGAVSVPPPILLPETPVGGSSASDPAPMV